MEILIVLISLTIGFYLMRIIGNRLSNGRSKNGQKITIFMIAYFSILFSIPTNVLNPKKDMVIEALIWLGAFFVAPWVTVLVGKSESDKKNPLYGATETTIYIGSILLSIGLMSVIESHLIG